MKVCFYTLGCKVNQAETRALQEQFQSYGYTIVPFGDFADIAVINTCSVTHVAERKSRNMLRRCLKTNAAMQIYVCGCYANLQAENLLKEIPEIYKVIPQEHKTSIAQWGIPMIGEHEPIISDGRFRQFLKIQDGCDQYCNYCIIPFARNTMHSLPLQEIMNEAQKLITQGITELVVTGINVGKYHTPTHRLTEVLEELSKLHGLKRIRLSSIEPNLIPLELIDVLANNELFAKHVHIPLQAGSNKILAAMGRRYSLAEYKKLIAYIRDRMPNISITTDLIIGYPGENAETLQETERTIHELQFSDMHVFPFSARPGTKAFSLKGSLSSAEVDAAIKHIDAMRQIYRQNFANSWLNKEIAVLIEEPIAGGWIGHSSEYIKTIINTTTTLHAGEIIHITPQKIDQKLSILHGYSNSAMILP